MEVIWARQDFLHLDPGMLRRSMFLAGPTLRRPGLTAWRAEAIWILERNIKFDGIIFVPENPIEPWDESYFVAQCDWEDAGLEAATCVAFWVPRDLVTLPGFTTNDEFGAYKRSGKVVLGYPPGTSKMRYMQYWADRLGIPVGHTLHQTMSLGVKKIETLSV